MPAASENSRLLRHSFLHTKMVACITPPVLFLRSLHLSIWSKRRACSAHSIRICAFRNIFCTRNELNDGICDICWLLVVSSVNTTPKPRATYVLKDDRFVDRSSKYNCTHSSIYQKNRRFESLIPSHARPFSNEANYLNPSKVPNSPRTYTPTHRFEYFITRKQKHLKPKWDNLRSKWKYYKIKE